MLARRLNRPFFEVMQWSAREIFEQMAFDRACDDDFCAQTRKELERERLRRMSPNERAAKIARDLKMVTGG